jgi:AraC-like DNA-binding protein
MEDDDLPHVVVNAYSGAPLGPRYEAWREDLCRSFCGLDVQPRGGDHIDCRLNISLLGSLSLAAPRGSSAQFLRTAEILSDGCDDFVLVTATKGRVLVVQGGRPIELAQSQMCLTDMSVVGAIGHDKHHQFTTTRIPRRLLLEVCPNIEDRLSVPIADHAALRDTIARYYALTAMHAARLDVHGQHLSAQHLVDLTALLFGARPDDADVAVQRGYSAARFELVKADVLANLAQADLHTATLALRHGLSARQMQRMFEQSGTTFSAFFLEQRLLRARRLLLDSRNRSRKISDIAHSSGFSDLSYFNRAFRKRFGATPSDMRPDTTPR